MIRRNVSFFSFLLVDKKIIIWNREVLSLELRFSIHVQMLISGFSNFFVRNNVGGIGGTDIGKRRTSCDAIDKDEFDEHLTIFNR